VYIAAYAGLYSLSSVYWFLPAGLRLAALWMSPRRDWWLLALGDMGAIALILLYRGNFTMYSTVMAAAVVPWCLYASIVAIFGRPPGANPTPESMVRFLVCGLGASAASALALTLINAIDDGAMHSRPIAVYFNFALGDFIGVLLMAPLLRILLAQVRGKPMAWEALFARGLVFVPALCALALNALPVERTEFDPVVLSSFALFWIAYRFGWRAGAISLILLSTGVHIVEEDIFRVWQPVQLQLFMAAAGFATLTLGISADSLRTQDRALRASIDMLSTRTRALAEAANRIVSQQEDERRRIGAELHDQLGQDMTAIATRLRLVARATDAPHVRDGLRSIESLVADAHEHLRETIQSLHPLVLDRFGLARALKEGPMAELARAHDIDYQCIIEGEVDALPADIATAIYRICQEVTTNCVRHGCGGRMRIDLTLHRHLIASDLMLRIEDDAGTFDITSGKMGLGLQNIYDRADAIGAEYTFDPDSGDPRHLLEVRVKNGTEPAAN
jgi:two-component system sensor histidine kinase UhpB